MFDPTRRTSWRASDIRRAQLWTDVKLYLLVLGILGIPTALILWALVEWFG